MSVSPTEDDQTRVADEPVSHEDTGAATEAPQDDKTADSSTADEGSTEKGSILDAVSSALKEGDGEGEEDEAAESSPGSEEGGGEKDGAEAKSTDEDDLGELTDEELNRYKPRTQRRMKQLLGRIDEANKKTEELQPKAEAFEKIESFARENSIDEQTMNSLITYPVMRRDKPELALQMIEKEYHELLAETGKQLPDDLKQQVDHGYLTQQYAQELSERRAREQREKTRAEQEREAQQRQAQEQQKNLVGDVQSALSEWEDNWSKSDPDYRVKRDEVHEQVELELIRRQQNRNLPQNRDEAVQMVEQARKRVEERHKRLRPQKPESRHVSGGTASSEAKSKPKSMFDVIDSVVG